LHECATAILRAQRAAIDEVEDDIIKIFFSGLRERSSRNNFPHTLIAGQIDSFSLDC
jgi:hypothetical protein